MIFIVDASVAIKWFVPETLRGEALRLIDDANQLYAPDLIVAEVTNTAWKKQRRGEITEAEAQAITQALPLYFISLPAAVDLAPRALEMALALGHPAYDCFYLACAEEVEGTLVTADERLLRAATNLPLSVAWLPDIDELL